MTRMLRVGVVVEEEEWEETKTSTFDGWIVGLGDLTVKVFICWTNFNCWQSEPFRCRCAFILKFGLDTSIVWPHCVHSTLLLLLFWT